MIDNFNRKINYLRVSLTQKCNYNCLYCKPEAKDTPLSLLQIDRIIRIFASLGIEHIRFSGGEPLIRKDLEQIIYNTKRNKNIKSISLTTNGSLLKNRIPNLIDSGLDNINISIDATNNLLYKKISGNHDVNPVLTSIRQSKTLGLNVKLNSILLKDYWIEQINQLTDLASEVKAPLKFIELMPIGVAKNIKGISSDEVIPYLIDKYGQPSTSFIKGIGPANYLRFNDVDYGFIDAISHNFCSSCNRIRLLSNGGIKLCLYQDPIINLKEISYLKDEEISILIKSTLKEKNERHNLKEKALKMSMASIGG